MRKQDFCQCENKGADQLCSNCTDSTIPPLLISKITSFLPSSETVQASLCLTWSETPKTSFLKSRLICFRISFVATRAKCAGREVVKNNYFTLEPPHGKTNNLHRRKQRRRSASR